MDELILSDKARTAYCLSPWKKLMEDRAGMLLSRGYSPGTVGNYLCHWVKFTREYEAKGAVLPHDVRCLEVANYLKRHWDQQTNTFSCARVALRHLLHDVDEDVRCLGRERQPATELSKKHLPDYLTYMLKHRGCRSSRGLERVLVNFFCWLDGRDIDDLGRVRQGEVRDYLASRKHFKRSSVALEASILRSFLRYLGMQGVVPVELAATVESPRLYRMSSPPAVLEEETAERFLNAVDRTTSLGKRDFAMLLLGARYGLRPCDIRGLRLENIHWREQRLEIVQSKTQRSLELPLLADVDEALVDYLRNGRPACNFREVFVRHKVPIAPLLESNNLWGVMRRAFKAAGIEPPSRQRGFYLLRHTAATRMLARGVPFDTISDILGHASVDTTRIYAQVDLKGLRSVALAVGEVCR